MYSFEYVTHAIYSVENVTHAINLVENVTHAIYSFENVTPFQLNRGHIMGHSVGISF